MGSRTAVYQAIQILVQRPVAIKVLRRDYPSFSESVQFRNQYAIAKRSLLGHYVMNFSRFRAKNVALVPIQALRFYQISRGSSCI
jgi:hypothetical protein